MQRVHSTEGDSTQCREGMVQRVHVQRVHSVEIEQRGCTVQRVHGREGAQCRGTQFTVQRVHGAEGARCMRKRIHSGEGVEDAQYRRMYGAGVKMDTGCMNCHRSSLVSLNFVIFLCYFLLISLELLNNF